MTESRLIYQAFERHREVLEKSFREILPDVEKAAALILEAVKSNRKVLICGNGGSAADSQHFATEFVCRYHRDRPPLKAIALTTNTSLLTAIGNDYSFENIFQRQVEALGESGDVLVAISTSGQSSNVLSAIKQAQSQNLKVIALTGQKGETLRPLVDVAIVVPSTETARVQELHELIYHSWCEFVEESIEKNET